MNQGNGQGFSRGQDLREARDAGFTGPPQDFHDDEISLKDLFDKLMAGKWLVLIGYALVLGVVAAYTYRDAPKYEASSMLLVNNESSTPQLGELMGLQVGNRNVANEIEIIKSRTIAMRVADYIMQSETIPGTTQQFSVLQTSPENPSLTQVDVANRLQNRYVTVSPVSRETDLITIKVSSTIPREAAFISNMYADEYVSYNLMQSRRRYTAGREFLEEQAEAADSVVSNAESNILTYAREQGAVDPQLEANALFQQMMELESELYRTDFQLRASQSELQTLESELNQITPGLARTLNSNSNEAIAGIRQAITKLQIDNAVKLSQNPDLATSPATDPEYQKNIQTIKDLTQDLNARTSTLVEEMFSEGSIILGQDSENAMAQIAALQLRLIEKRLEISGAQARKDVLDEQKGIYQSQIDRIPNKAVLLARFERAMDTSAQLYTTIFESLQEARIAERSELGYVDIIDQSVVPSAPVSPKVPLNLMLGAVLGLMLGVVSAFAKSAFDNRVYRPEDLRQRGFPLLGLVPDMQGVVKSDFGGAEFVDVEGRKVSTSLYTLLNPLSPVSEAYRRLRTNVDYSAPDSSRKVVLVTSAEPGEGKTATSMNLAIANAQLGRKTLFVDADMRRPTSHRLLNIPREPGLVDWLFDESIRDVKRLSTHIQDLSMMPVGKAAPNPAELLGSVRMKDLLQLFRKEFDTIIIDSPPLLSVSDGLLLAPLSDMIIQVVSSGETHWAALERSREILSDLGIRSAGVVLNRFDAHKAYGGYGYGSGSGYGYGYGYGVGYGQDATMYADRELQEVAQSTRRI